MLKKKNKFNWRVTWGNSKTDRTRAKFIAFQEEQLRGEELGTVRRKKQKLTEVEKQLKLLESIRLRVAKKTKPVQTLNQQAEEVRARIGAVQETLNGKNLDVGFQNVEKEETTLIKKTKKIITKKKHKQRYAARTEKEMPMKKGLTEHSHWITWKG